MLEEIRDVHSEYWVYTTEELDKKKKELEKKEEIDEMA